MDTIANWWDALDGVMKFFYAVAFTSSAILVFQTLLMLLGMDADTDFDLDHGSGDSSILSLRTLTAFLVGLGWMGAILRDLGWSLILVLPLALLTGIILMMTVFWFMRMLHSMRESGNLDYAYAIGEIGTVYLPIAPQKKKPGKIEVLVQGRLRVVDAFTMAEERIENHIKVRVLDVVGDNALLVEPIE